MASNVSTTTYLVTMANAVTALQAVDAHITKILSIVPSGSNFRITCNTFQSGFTVTNIIVDVTKTDIASFLNTYSSIVVVANTISNVAIWSDPLYLAVTTA